MDATNYDSGKEVSEFIEKMAKAGEKIYQNYQENHSGYHNDLRDMASTYSDLASKVLFNPEEMKKVQHIFLQTLQKQQQLVVNAMEGNTSGKQKEPVIIPREQDKRFRAPEWSDQPYFDYLKQSYLLMSEMMRRMVDSVELEEKTKRKLHFYTGQYIDALSPSNFALTNPEALKRAQETKGESFKQGLNNLLEDIEKGHITQTDESAFEVGKNIAMTPGSVVYQNDLIQLIQYTPTTKQVHEIPLLVVPPWINKYYILDLRPENSFVRYMVDQGFTVFIISWVNPTSEMSHVSFDDYVEKGVIEATGVIQSIMRSAKVNMIGYCLGGTLLGVALSVLYARKKVPVQSASFLCAMIDFSDVGPMGDVIDRALVRKLERGELHKFGIMHGHQMEVAFNLIRANDLIWSYVVSSYLMGKKPSPFDILYWTNDNTNLPANMYIYYLRHMLLENRLSRKNALRLCDTPIDIGRIDAPCFVIGMKEDHISPAHTAFTTTELVSGKVEYLLGGSGHVMGVANSPSKNKYGYRRNGELGKGFDEWNKTSQQFEGSWWTPWSEWLGKQSGKLKAAPKQAGNKKYPVIEAAPGSYVKVKASVNLKTE